MKLEKPMEYKRVDKALEFIKGKLDEKTYTHSIRVANYAIENPIFNCCRGLIKEDLLYIIALLHDVVEDSNTTFSEISDTLKMDEIFIKRTLGRLTKSKLEDYNTYITKLRESNDIYAYIVKLADMKDHLEQTGTLTDKLKEKYLKALPILL